MCREPSIHCLRNKVKEALNAFFKSFASSANIYMLAIICLLGKPQSPMNRPLRWSGCAAFCRFLALPGNEKNKNPAFGTCENRLFDAYPLRGFFMGTSIAILKNKKFVFGRVQKLRSRCLSPERIFFSNSCWTFCKNTMSADYAKQRN